MSDNDDVIVLLESVLAEARAGNVKSIALCGTKPNNKYSTAFIASKEDCLSLIGACALLSAEIHKSLT